MSDSTIQSKFDLTETSKNYPNVLQQDKFKLSFTNLPSVTDFKDMRYYENYARSVIFPDYNLQVIMDDFQAWQTIHPLTKANDSLSDLQCTFKLSEDMFNYLNLFDWMRQIRYGDINTDRSQLVSKNSIDAIILSILDNQKRTIATVQFKNAFVVSLSSLPLTFGDASEVEFTVNFKYRKMEFQTHSIFGS